MVIVCVPLVGFAVISKKPAILIFLNLFLEHLTFLMSMEN